jgi:SAM-dependent methyltransferase
MAEATDYFSNHSLKLRFPWRLYHAPIVAAASSALRAAPGPRVLNLGSGPFLELPLLPEGNFAWTLADIDERAIEFARRLHGSRIERADVVPVAGPLPYPDGVFDLVVSMDVIEHLPDPSPWLAEAIRVLKPGGHLFLTTPNYGSFSLRFLESTVLELIARAQRFTRKGLHPTRFDRSTLQTLLEQSGLHVRQVDAISHGWVLSAHAARPAPTSQTSSSTASGS